VRSLADAIDRFDDVGSGSCVDVVNAPHRSTFVFTATDDDSDEKLLIRPPALIASTASRRCGLPKIVQGPRVQVDFANKQMTRSQARFRERQLDDVRQPELKV